VAVDEGVVVVQDGVIVGGHHPPARIRGGCGQVAVYLARGRLPGWGEVAEKPVAATEVLHSLAVFRLNVIV
jgi:hypothetical protein